MRPLIKLADCCSFYSGGTPSKSKPEYWKGDIPWFSPKDIKKYDLILSQDKISEVAVSESATRLVEAGTILVLSQKS
jgi:type I restriction enzyme S subunit